MHGGGTIGYGGLVVTAKVYETIAAGMLFNCSATPMIQPVIPAGATSALIGKLVRLNTKAKHNFNEGNNIEKALKAQVEKAIEVLYLIGICDCTTGFANITLVVMLTHLFANYGAISVIQLQANNAEMSKEWDPNTPIELLFMQIEEAQEFADDRNAPYSNIQVLNKAYNLVFKTSPFKRACHEWNACPTNKKTWTNFKIHFSTPQVVVQEEMDTETVGYYGANAVMSQENLQHQVEALASLATTITSDRVKLLTS
jgi:hypothetical protein